MPILLSRVASENTTFFKTICSSIFDKLDRNDCKIIAEKIVRKASDYVYISSML